MGEKKEKGKTSILKQMVPIMVLLREVTIKVVRIIIKVVKIPQIVTTILVIHIMGEAPLTNTMTGATIGIRIMVRFQEGKIETRVVKAVIILVNTDIILAKKSRPQKTV